MHGMAVELRHLRFFVAAVEEGQPDDGRRASAAHLPAFTEPADSRPGIPGRDRAAISQRSRRRADRRRQGLSRSCPAGAGAGRCRGGSGAQGRTACKKDVRHRLPNRSRDELAAEGHAFDLGYEVVDHEPLIVLMPSDHRLTSREAIHPREFVGEIFIGGSNNA